MTVGGRRDASSVRHAGDSAKTFRGLSVSHDDAVGCINARKVGIIGVARFESVILSVIRSIVSTTNAVVDVLTVVGSIGSRGVTSLHAEKVAAHEANVDVKLTDCFLF